MNGLYFQNETKRNGFLGSIIWQQSLENLCVFMATQDLEDTKHRKLNMCK